MTQNNNVNIFAFYSSVDFQNHRKDWVSKPYGLITSRKSIPPFQIPKPKNGVDITVFNLINLKTGVSVDLLSDMVIRGLKIETDNEWNYDLIVYPSSVDLSTEFYGKYYVEMSDGFSSFYSDIFTFCDVSEMIKLEYWHCEDFLYPNGHFQYKYPYKNRIYISSDIGKPSYEYEDVVKKRDGYNFFIQQISYKLNKFEFLCPEYFIDGLRLVRLHSNVVINYKSQEYIVNEFLMGNPRWEQKGDLASVLIEFKTDTVVVSNARAYDSCDYLPENGGCIDQDVTTVALIVENSSDYNNFTYTDINGVLQNMVDHDKILIDEIAGNKIVKTYLGGAYTFYVPLPNYDLYNKNTNEYFLNDDPGFVKPYIISVELEKVIGKSFNNSIIEVYGRDGSGNDHLIGQGITSDLEGTGIDIVTTGLGIELVKIVTITPTCGIIDTSNWFVFPEALIGIGVDIVGSTLVQ